MSRINFEDKELDASHGVTKLLLAAEHWKRETMRLRAILSDVKAWDISHAVEPPPMQPTLFTLPQELRAKIQKAIE